MMQSCGVCFPLKRGDAALGIETEYAAPDLLPEKAAIQEELDKEWDSTQPVEETFFHYGLLHQGLIRAILSRIGSEAGISATYWQGGVCVYETTTHCHALIEQEMENDQAGRIRMQTQGGQPAALRDQLAALVEAEEQRIGLTSRKSKILRAEVREFMYVGGTLAATEDTDRVVVSGEVFGAETKEKANETLSKKRAGLGFRAPPSPQLRYYVSYAWSDEGTDREAVVNKLCDEAAKRGTPILHGARVWRQHRKVHEGYRKGGPCLCDFERQIFEVAILYV
jgi:internalin A